MSLVRNIAVSAGLVVCSSAALAQTGTPQEQAACRPDVRRYCYKVHENEGSGAFLQCLQEHRAKLSSRCRAVLESHGV